jgi:hypothetical protein
MNSIYHANRTQRKRKSKYKKLQSKETKNSFELGRNGFRLVALWMMMMMMMTKI